MTTSGAADPRLEALPGRLLLYRSKCGAAPEDLQPRRQAGGLRHIIAL
jgi:hypothetical protein